MTRRIDGMGDQGVAALLYGQGQWRQAAAEVLRLAHSSPDSPGRLRQPLIVACGHSLGANAMGKFARLPGQSGLDVLAGRLYRRAGIFKGIPARGYLLAHDARVQGYICSAVRILLRLSAEGANLQGHPESLR